MTALPIHSGDWTLDQAHTTVGFTVRHLGITGQLSLNGHTKPLDLDTEFLGAATLPGDGSFHVGFSATGSLSRKAFGVDFNVPLAAGGFVIADQVNIDIDMQLLPVAARAA